MIRIGAILAGLLALSSCTTTPPSVEEQLSDSGYTRVQDLPSSKEATFHIQVWKKDDVEVVISNALSQSSGMEILSIAESASTTGANTIFSCEPIQREQVSPSVDSFQAAKQIFTQGKAVATPLFEGSGILEVQLPSPHKCHLIPKE